MNRIKILSELMINKISAGEVVDRPCSVVKELIENSIDAGAKRIQILIKSAGKELISVLDDGCGMNSEEARLCIERHATGKITRVEDLEKILTLGFRGEALAAISAVSRFELHSCHDENEGGNFIAIEGEKITSIGKVGFPKGTRITVEDLFFNTPARKKFLKTDNTEFQKIQEFLLCVAVSHCELHLKITHNKKKIYDLVPAKSTRDRIMQIYGREFIKDLAVFEYEEPALKFSGLFSRPTAGRPSGRWQQIFVNRRYIKAPFINYAIREAYKTVLMKNLHPMFFILIEIPPEEIDVNVHPAKTEIRFKNQSLIYTILTQTLQKFLKEETRSRFTDKSSSNNFRVPGKFSGDISAKKSSLGDHSVIPERIETAQVSIDFPVDEESKTPKIENPEKTSKIVEPTKNSLEDDGGLFHFSFDGEKKSQAVILADEKSHWVAIGEFAEYIIANAENRLLIVDKHAAHERIRFEEIRNEYFSGQVKSVTKVIPEMIVLPPQDAIKIENYAEFWEKIGFEIEHFGKNDFSIKAVPFLFKNREIAPIIRDVLDEAALFGKAGNMEKYCNQIFERMACYSAIRGRQSMNLQEMQNLLDQLIALDIHLYCPHGRPVVIEITDKELEKRFKRIV